MQPCIKPVLIALGHKSRVGKDTALFFIEQYYADCWRSLTNEDDTESQNYKTSYCVYHLSFAGALYKCTKLIQEFFDKPVEKDAILLQKLGTILRETPGYGEDIWLDIVMRNMHSIITKHKFEDSRTPVIVITDVRYPNEYARLLKESFHLIKIHRTNRPPINRDPNHESEIALDNYEFPYNITNDGSEEEFAEKIYDLMRQFA